MKRIDRLLSAVGLQRRSLAATSPVAGPPHMGGWFGGAETVMGGAAALRSTTVYACVSLIASTVAGLTVSVRRHDADGSTSATAHPLNDLLSMRPSVGWTAYDWLHTMTASAVLTGDAFAIIQTRADGSVAALDPLDNLEIQPVLTRRRRIAYDYQPATGGPMRRLTDRQILRFPYRLAADRVQSLSPIATHATTIDSALAATTHTQATYRNAGTPRGVLTSDHPLDETARTRVANSWTDRHGGPSNAGRVAILEPTMKFQPVSMSMQDAQYLELLQYSVSDIARIFQVPPHKVNELSNATYSNIEHQNIDFLNHTIMPWIRRFQARMNMYLLTENERRQGLRIVFDVKNISMADSKTRSEYYRSMYHSGSLTPNEIRGMEGLNPYDGGDQFWTQGANMPVELVLKQSEKEQP